MSTGVRRPPSGRPAYRRFTAITPRWNDIDVFGHVNNAEFYGYFDTAVLQFMTEIGAVSALDGPYATLVVESGARFHRAVLFNDRVEVGLAVAHLGASSVRYAIGVFTAGNADAAVDGHFVHVFVDRVSRRSTPIPDATRGRLEELLVNAPSG